MLPRPLQFIIALVAYAINKQMARRIEYLLEEVRVLREVYAETTGRERISFTDEQRRRLAVKGKALTPEEREGCCQVVRPGTILAWFRQLAARKYDGSQQRRKLGRPRKHNDIRELVLTEGTDSRHCRDGRDGTHGHFTLLGAVSRGWYVPSGPWCVPAALLVHIPGAPHSQFRVPTPASVNPSPSGDGVTRQGQSRACWNTAGRLLGRSAGQVVGGASPSARQLLWGDMPSRGFPVEAMRLRNHQQPIAGIVDLKRGNCNAKRTVTSVVYLRSHAAFRGLRR